MKIYNWKIKLLNVLLVLLVIFLSYSVIKLFVDASGGLVFWQADTKIWSEFGSFIGAILLAATLLYQIRAFRRQQIEAKFFEMLKYYRDNISEMRFRNPFYYKNKNGRVVDEDYVTGRRVVKTIFEQYKVGVKIAKSVNYLPIDTKSNEKLFETTNQNFKKNGWGEDLNNSEWQKLLNISEVAYLITFWGIPLDTDIELKNHLDTMLSDDAKKALVNEVKSVVTVYDFEEENQATYSGNLKFTDRGIFDDITQPEPDNTNLKFFGGHQYHLGHYFRHLFQAVKYIDQQPWWLFYRWEKYAYVKTLRAQMSNYEQALLFLNSLTQLGRKWEYENDFGKCLISKYNLIKNLPRNFIPDMEPQNYYPEVDFEWKKNYQLSKNKPMKTVSTIKMGNDEFILYIRKKNKNCKTLNPILGRKIWEWILLKDPSAKEIKKDADCLWGDNILNTDPEILPKTATQFEFKRTLLPDLYDYLDSLASE